MKIQTLVKVINPALAGVSKSSGNPYKIQEVVLEWQEADANGILHPQRVVATLFNQSVDNFAALNPVAGQTIVDADLQFSTRPSSTNRVYNDIVARF